MLYSLYVKTHLDTGLKYLGFTEQNPFLYKGSGTRWNNHIKAHGNNVWTNVIFQTEIKENIKIMGVYYSNLWNITDSDEWANLKPEEGQGGSIKHTSEAIFKIKEARSKQTITKETRNKFSKRCSNSKWFNNGVEERFTVLHPDGWIPGRLFRNRKSINSSSHLKNTVYYNDGIKNYRVIPEDAKPQWKIGMLPRKD